MRLYKPEFTQSMHWYSVKVDAQQNIITLKPKIVNMVSSEMLSPKCLKNVQNTANSIIKHIVIDYCTTSLSWIWATCAALMTASAWRETLLIWSIHCLFSVCSWNLFIWTRKFCLSTLLRERHVTKFLCHSDESMNYKSYIENFQPKADIHVN